MTLNLFFSWQMETDLQGFNNKSFLLDCLDDAIDIANKQLKGAKVKLHEGLRDSSGAGPVAAEMFRQIDECDIFVGDLTVVQRLCKRAEIIRNKKCLYFRYSPNCNVYGEYNRALGKRLDFWKQTILLMNEANRSVCDDKGVIPFDTQENRWPILFSLNDDTEKSKESAREALLNILPNEIAKCAREALKHMDAKYKPFVSWYTQDCFGGQKNFDDAQVITKYKDKILKKNGVFCMIGPKGTRKTTLVHKVFEEEPYCNEYLYVDSDDDDINDYKDALSNIFKNSNKAIVVIDNSCSKDFASILKWRRKFNAGNQIVVLLNEELEVIPELADYKYIVLDARNDIVRELNSNLEGKGVMSDELKLKVRNFCQNDTQFVSLIADAMTGSESASEFEGASLTTRLSGYRQDTMERKIMQSLALFEYVGFKDDRRGELEFILTNKFITSIDAENTVLINTASSIIKAGVRRGTFVERGRTISITPRTMANQLIEEWLESVDEKRLIEVIESIDASEYKTRLMQEFHDRFMFLGNSDEASALVAGILKPGSVFEKYTVLNTNECAMLLESFAQVNPFAVTALLSRAINSMPQEELLALEGGRRYLVWTLDKLCFRADTFKQSATMMLRLANAENEEISNNATGQFVGLFPIMLPATEANLIIRLEFLKEQFSVQQKRSVLMSALKRALTNRDFILFSGAESMGENKLEPYRPKTNAEIASYFSGCLDILLSEIKNNTEFASKAYEILEETVVSLCEGGWASIVLPAVKTVAEQKNYEWDRMQNTLCFFYERVKNVLEIKDRQLYEELMSKLTKQDPVSRFLRVEKESYYSEVGLRQSFEERIQKNQETFDALANEFYENNLLDKDILCKLICSENISTTPFGRTLAKRMLTEEKINFVHDMIGAINDSEKPSIDILCQFVAEVDEKLFLKLIPILKQSKITYTLFACIGARNIKPEEDAFKNLREMVQSNRASVEDYNQYWTRLIINQLTDDDCINLFSEIISFKGGFAVVVRMSYFLLMDKKLLEHLSLANFMVQAFLNYKEGSLLNVNMALNNANVLIQAIDCPELARRINDEVLDLARSSTSSISHNYELEITYRILMTKYFEVVWPSLSQLLIADGSDIMTYYNMKWFLGVDMVDRNNPIITEGNHIEEMKSWLEAHPDIAPIRLAGLIQVVDDHGDFTPEAMFLINTYGSNKNVLTELGCSIDSFASFGSAIPQYEYRRGIYSKLLNHDNEDVRVWAQNQVNSYDYMIDLEGNREQEKM